ncbi:MAG: Nre family DNA repair protein [Candidatus Hydrothermarchaeota archaeon]|nr:Nre family DNA repair protein [Candidatus Hydrothermarchaeota archaeon]
MCRGAKLLCGKRSCPVLVKYYASEKIMPLIDGFELNGASPPGVFVGRMGYPKVNIGPLISPLHGETSYLDLPELWGDKSMEDIVSFRFQLVRGKYRVNAIEPNRGGRILDLTRELALCKNSAEVEASFVKKPLGRIALDDEVQPYGPSAPLLSMELGTLKTDRDIEKAHYDFDLKAGDAALVLYGKGAFVTKIQRAFSVGCFGVEKNRRLVPTRWSITAVDDVISKSLVEEIKDYPTIDEYRVYESWRLDNRFAVIMAPFSWSYELVEAWYPNTVWNPTGKKIVIYASHEGYHGRSKYADIGGCYYAARLAVGEALRKEGKQACVVILREAHPGYIMPVGVWNVRENVRNAMRQTPLKFESLKEVFKYVSMRLEIPGERWITKSEILKRVLYQRRLEDYLK